MKRMLIIIISLVFTNLATAQLKPGFDKQEYIQMLLISGRQIDTPWTNENMKLPYPKSYEFIYRSPITGLDNQWDMWADKKNKIAVVSLRGTTANGISWLENFFAAMVPARGTLRLGNGNNFGYKLADNPEAAVHIGWLVGMAHMAPDIIAQMNSYYENGYRDFILLGHSQGAAINYMLRCYVAQMQQEGKLQRDIRIKTYCSAAPKPGNLYFAYAYEHLTYGGWGITVVNSADWVPEVPMSLQTLDDYNAINPFVNASAMMGQQKFPKNIVLKLVYNKLRKPAYKLQKRYNNYLGNQAYKMVKQHLPGFEKPMFYKSSNYMRAGTPVVLMANEAYFKVFPNTNTDKIFLHHFMEPYLWLTERLPD
jgi:Lipase (class 3).